MPLPKVEAATLHENICKLSSLTTKAISDLVGAPEGGH